MKYAAMTGLFLTVAAAGSVWAHSGATGIVKERMDGMMSMAKAVKAMTPMMRGKADYDAEAVREFAETIGKHSGAAMTELFPEGSDDAPSGVKPSVWTAWDDFEALAERLEMLSEGLALAADNGLKGRGAASGMMGGGMMEGGGTMGGADMMGGGTMGGADMMGSGMMGDGGMMSASAGMADLVPEDLAEMPADAVFNMVSQTCAACHTKFRTER